MRCPYCNYSDTQVKDSRPTEDNAVIRRRRSCPQCGARFTTFERVQLRGKVLKSIAKNPDDLASVEEEVKKEVITLCKEFPLYSSLSYN